MQTLIAPQADSRRKKPSRRVHTKSIADEATGSDPIRTVLTELVLALSGQSAAQIRLIANPPHFDRSVIISPLEPFGSGSDGPVTHCILHIGLEKTGTTSIQFALAQSRTVLREHDILYPRSLGERSHLKVYAVASDDGPNEIKFLCGLRDQSELVKFRRRTSEEFADEIGITSPRMVIISNEHCSSRLRTTSELAHLREFLLPHFKSITVFAYLRSQGDSLRSAYSTAIKTGSCGEFAFPTDSEIESKYDYDRIISRWETVFGIKNVTLRLYEQAIAQSGDTVTDFVDTFLGLNRIDKFVSKAPRNISLSNSSIEFLRQINSLVPYQRDGRMNPIRGNLHELIEKFDSGPPFAGDHAIIKAIDEAMREGNERVRQRYFANTPAPLFKSLPRAAEAELGTQPIPEDAVRLMANLWEAKQRQVLQLRSELEEARKFKVRNRSGKPG